MTPEEAPAGTIIILGHPANGITARKDESGEWFYTFPGIAVKPQFDDIHRGFAVYIPGILP